MKISSFLSIESQQIKTLAPSHFPVASAEVLSIRTWGHAILPEARKQ